VVWRLRARFVVGGEGLDVYEDGVVEVDDEGRVVGVGRYSGGSFANLGDVVVTPQLVNAHVHVLDAAFVDRWDWDYIDDVVGWPFGAKYAAVKSLNERTVERVISSVARAMKRRGTCAALIYVEYGRRFGRVVRDVFTRVGIDALAFLEPNDGFVPGEPLEVASPLDHDLDTLRSWTSQSPIASTHVSETPDTYSEGDLWLALAAGFRVLVHLTYLDKAELESLPSWVIPVTNPRANSFFVWRLPRIDVLAELGALMGTDNVFAVEPDLWEELRFAYYAARGAGMRVLARDLFAMVTANAWRRLGLCPPIIPGHVFRGVAISLGGYSIDAGRVFEYLVKRASEARILALFEGSRVIDPGSV